MPGHSGGSPSTTSRSTRLRSNCLCAIVSIGSERLSWLSTGPATRFRRPIDGRRTMVGTKNWHLNANDRAKMIYSGVGCRPPSGGALWTRYTRRSPRVEPGPVRQRRTKIWVTAVSAALGCFEIVPHRIKLGRGNRTDGLSLRACAARVTDRSTRSKRLQAQRIFALDCKNAVGADRLIFDAVRSRNPPALSPSRMTEDPSVPRPR